MTDNKKRSFVLYKSWGEHVSKLNNEQAGNLISSVLKYVNGQEVNLIQDIVVTELYIRMIDQIEFEWSKYNPKTEKYHWNYKGGITDDNKAIRNSTNYKYWRKSVFERDNYTCQNKECNKVGGELNAHHIKHFATHPEFRLMLFNGLTLCKKCHIKEHSK